MVEKTDCCYKTPCGWCSKWDKRCDLKLGNTSDVYENQVFTKKYPYPNIDRDFRYDTGPTCACNTTSADGCGETLKQN